MGRFGVVFFLASLPLNISNDLQAGTPSFYFLALDQGLTIDAKDKANLARFINHSCNPNCITQVWNVAGEPRAGIFAVRDIPAGEELTFDYQVCLFIVVLFYFCLTFFLAARLAWQQYEETVPLRGGQLLGVHRRQAADTRETGRACGSRRSCVGCGCGCPPPQGVAG